MLAINQIYHGDCLELMKDIPDKSIDLILTDPPYGINENNKKNLSRGKLAKCSNFEDYYWDKEKINNLYFKEIKRISKNQIIFGGNYYCQYLGNTNCFIVWNKDNGFNDFADCELAWTSFKSATRIFKYRWNGMLQEHMDKKEIRIHPTQKPINLFAWILINYSKENDLILDCFAGSGTTAIASILTNRNFILIEKEEKYFNLAKKRIELELKKIRLAI